MVCPKCGAQLADDAQFCTNCGETVGTVSPAPAAPSDKVTGFINTVSQGKAEYKAFIGAGLLLISMIFSFLNVLKGTYSISFMGYSTSGSETGGMFSEKAGVLVVVILAYLAGIVMLLLPKFQNNVWGFKNYIAAMAAPAFAFIWFFIEMIDLNSKGQGIAKFAPSFLGYIFLFVTLVAIAYNVKVGIDTKNGK